jgi:hypothetical protein
LGICVAPSQPNLSALALGAVGRVRYLCNTADRQHHWVTHALLSHTVQNSVNSKLEQRSLLATFVRVRICDLLHANVRCCDRSAIFFLTMIL